VALNMHTRAPTSSSYFLMFSSLYRPQQQKFASGE
jgi:hypothetical protein